MDEVRGDDEGTGKTWPGPVYEMNGEKDEVHLDNVVKRTGETTRNKIQRGGKTRERKAKADLSKAVHLYY